MSEREHRTWAKLLTLDHLVELRIPLYGQEMTLSPDGKLVAYVLGLQSQDSDEVQSFPTGAPRTVAGAELWVTDLEDGATTRIIDGGRSWRPVWSPKGDQLAFYSDVEGAVNLWLWHAVSKKMDRLSEAPVFSRFGLGHDSPVWSQKGESVFVPLRPASWSPGKPDAFFVFDDEWEQDDFNPTVDVLTSPAPAEEALPGFGGGADDFSDVGKIHVGSGETERLLTDFPVTGFFLSPDGHWIVLMGRQRLLGPPEHEQMKMVSDLYLSPAAGGEPKVLAENLESGRTGRHPPRWAPDSSQMAFIREGAIWVVTVEHSEPRRVESDVMALRDYLAWSHDSKSLLFFESPGDEILFPESHDAWLISVEDGTLTRLDVPKEAERLSFVSRSETSWFFSIEGSALLQALDRNTKDSQIWRLPLDGSAAILMVSESRNLTQLEPTEPTESTTPQIAFFAEDEATPPDIWISDLEFKKSRQLTRINPQLDAISLGHSRLVSWLTDEGKQTYGSLLLPADHTEGERVPVVFEIYPVPMSRGLHRWGAGGGVIPHQMLASRGYGVFMPDIEAGPSGFPKQRLSSTLLPAVNELINLGIADPERIGVMGQSAGGWATNEIITQTSRFKVAISAAGISNMVSLFGELAILSNGGAFAYGQPLTEAYAGGPPWERPLQYIEHSAVFHLDKVETPLLILHGTRDTSVDIGQAAEMFVGLRRLGKKATFARYRRQGHVPGRYPLPNRRDVYDRVIAWLDEHLAVPKERETTQSRT